VYSTYTRGRQRVSVIKVKHLYLKDSVYNRTKYKTWLYLSIVEQHYGKGAALTVEDISRDIGLPRHSLQTLVGVWSSPSWRRLLRRTVPGPYGTTRYAYILSAKGRKWLAGCDTWIPEAVRSGWVAEIRVHQQKMAELKRRQEFNEKMSLQSQQMAEEYFKAHGHYPE
jgi:hypothetical protein